MFKSDLDKLLLDGQEYTPQELKDKITQYEKEKENPDSGDFIIFHDKQFRVKKATFGVVKRVAMNPIERRNDLVNLKLKYLIAVTEQLTNELSKSDKFNLFKKLLLSYLLLKIKIKQSEFFQRRALEREFRLNVKDWKELVELTFEGDLSEMELENLTPQEVTRLKRIFFRWRPAQDQEKPDK